MNQTEPTKVKVDGGCIVQPQSQLFIISPPVIEIEYAPEERDCVFKEIWDNLSKMDVSDCVDQKDGLNYLPWSDCISILRTEYPDTQCHTYWFPAEGGLWQKACHEVSGYSVQTGITIKGIHKFISLPIWSGRPPKAVIEPDSMHINTAIMRCLVKTAAFGFGLGLYIYRGEDLPVEPQPEPANMLPKPEPAMLPKPEVMLSDNQRELIDTALTFDDAKIPDVVKEYLLQQFNSDDLSKLIKKDPPVVTKELAKRILNQWEDKDE